MKQSGQHGREDNWNFNLYKMEHLINHTSADDMKVSLKHINPTSLRELNRDIDYLRKSLNNEVANSNRPTVIKALQVKIRKLEKEKRRFLNG